MTSRAHIFVSGRVQGVFFRASTRDEARRLGLKGWVRNLPDGRVEAVFEGDRKDVSKMLLWCSHGPDSAEVEDLESVWEEAGGDFQTFELRY